MAKSGWLWVVGVAVVLLLLTNSGQFDLGKLFGGNNGQVPIYPSDLETTVTINTRDALAATDIGANISYYVFGKSDGRYIKSGSTTAGTGSFTVNYGQEYDVIAYIDSGTKYYPVEVSFLADSGEGAQKTLNIGLNRVSNATINKVRDPVDLTGNVTVGAGQQVNFDVLYSVTTASSAVYMPVIIVDVNQTAVSDVNLGGLAKVTCPTRLAVTANRKIFCYQAQTLLSTEGIRTISGNLLFAASVTPSTLDYMKVTIADTQMYADPNYAVTGKSAFKTGTENPNDLSNVGATDNNAAADTVSHSDTVAYLYFGAN